MAFVLYISKLINFRTIFKTFVVSLGREPYSTLMWSDLFTKPVLDPVTKTVSLYIVKTNLVPR